MSVQRVMRPRLFNAHIFRVTPPSRTNLRTITLFRPIRSLLGFKDPQTTHLLPTQTRVHNLQTQLHTLHKKARVPPSITMSIRQGLPDDEMKLQELVERAEVYQSVRGSYLGDLTVAILSMMFGVGVFGWIEYDAWEEARREGGVGRG